MSSCPKPNQLSHHVLLAYLVRNVPPNCWRWRNGFAASTLSTLPGVLPSSSPWLEMLNSLFLSFCQFPLLSSFLYFVKPSSSPLLQMLNSVLLSYQKYIFTWLYGSCLLLAQVQSACQGSPSPADTWQGQEYLIDQLDQGGVFLVTTIAY